MDVAVAELLHIEEIEDPSSYYITSNLSSSTVFSFVYSIWLFSSPPFSQKKKA